MKEIKVHLKLPFGDLVVCGTSKAEILEELNSIDREFISEINECLTSLFEKGENKDLREIVEIDRDDPIIITKKDMSHYEAIGLILYCSKNHQATSKEIKKRLAMSGKEVTVPARLYEMKKRGYIFKPVEKGFLHRLSSKGIKWVEEEVIPKLKKKQSPSNP
mgnify:CR=1 FL=1